MRVKRYRHMRQLIGYDTIFPAIYIEEKSWIRGPTWLRFFFMRRWTTSHRHNGGSITYSFECDLPE
jgi:hypothetical protein